MNASIVRITSMTTGLAACAALAALTLTADARSPRSTIPAQTVYYGDLRLDSPAGIQALYGRIKAAARHVCNASVVDLEFLQQRALWQQCIDDAVARAVAKVNNEGLTAMHAQSQSKKVS